VNIISAALGTRPDVVQLTVDPLPRVGVISCRPATLKIARWRYTLALTQTNVVLYNFDVARINNQQPYAVDLLGAQLLIEAGGWIYGTTRINSFIATSK